MKLAISDDAHYVISTDSKNHAVLWDLKKHTSKLISRNANMYSAYWVLTTPYYVWQSLKDTVIHVTNVSTQRDIKTIKLSKVVYGEALSSDLRNYVASDIYWDIFLFRDNRWHELVGSYLGGSFFGANKIIGFYFLNNNVVLSSAFSAADTGFGPTLWNLEQASRIRDYIGNNVQTFATISPDGKYVVGGDANGGNLFMWETQTGKRIYKGPSLYLGYLNTHGTKDQSKWTTDKTKLIKMPQDFDDAHVSATIRSIKFIDNDEYLVFYEGSHYAVLFSTQTPWPIKYLDLGAYPQPALAYFERDGAIDTSASKHILVMAKEHFPGILVYQYDPKTQTLKKIWNAS